MNIRGIHAIYRYEMNRSFRTLIQSLVSPVLSTILYFIVFGSSTVAAYFVKVFA